MFTITADNLLRFMNCNGSVRMTPAFPPLLSDQTARDEGNAAHWLSVKLFDGDRIDSGHKAPNGIVITSEMIDHVEAYLSSLNCGDMEAETSFGNDQWRVNARCDHRKYDPSDNSLTIDDLKYGRRQVDPDMNWTLIAHAIGSCIILGIQPDRIILRIHQPRIYHPDGPVRSWEFTYQQLGEFWQQIAETMVNPRDELRTGLSWCAKCSALGSCPAARIAGMNATDASTLTFNDDMPNNALSYEMDALRISTGMIAARLEALEELAKHRLKNGAVIDDYGLENQYANTRFKSGISGELLTMTTGINCVKTSTITPAEFKRRGGSETLITQLTERPLTGVKLIRASADTRAKRLLGRK